MALPRLTQKQDTFAKLMAAGGYSAYRAAREAGYTQASASNIAARMLKDQKILDWIEKYSRAKTDMDTIDTAWVVKELVDTYRRAKEANQNASAISALSQLAKHTGGFEGGEQAQTTNYNLILAGMTPAEIRELAKVQLPDERVVKLDTPMEEVDVGWRPLATEQTGVRDGVGEGALVP
jgi:phage terminase small subunit